MDPSDRERVEAEVRAACGRQDFDTAATLALRAYGPELLGFLAAVQGVEGDASEAFSELSEILWRKLPDFAWQSTLRTWAYAIARNVSRTLKRDNARRERRAVRGSDSVVEGVAADIRTQTLPYLRTETKTRLQALRDQLPVEDRMLLILRVDRQLPWTDLARVLAASDDDDDAPLDEVALARESARLRKRFQLVRDRLRELAKREGLLE